MFAITKEQIEKLRPLIENLDELLARETDEDLLLALDDLVIEELDDDQQNLSQKGVKLQKLWDDIFRAND